MLNGRVGRGGTGLETRALSASGRWDVGLGTLAPPRAVRASGGGGFCGVLVRRRFGVARDGCKIGSVHLSYLRSRRLQRRLFYLGTEFSITTAVPVNGERTHGIVYHAVPAIHLRDVDERRDHVVASAAGRC